jgi:hypothetical protein
MFDCKRDSLLDLRFMEDYPAHIEVKRLLP